MITENKQFNSFFEEIEKNLKDKVKIYVIGGGALLMRGLKQSTKDLDLIVESKTEFKEVSNALISSGFKTKELSFLYERFELGHQFIKGEFQIDLFCKNVCSKLQLSENMMKRSENILKIGKINVFLVSNEDIFLFKTMTSRPGDLIDCSNIIKSGLNWASVLSEMKYQIKTYGEDVWITWIGERLDLLEDQGLNIPILKEVDKLRIEYLEAFEKRKL